MDVCKELHAVEEMSVVDEEVDADEPSPYDSDTEDIDLDEFVKSLSHNVNQWNIYQAENFNLEMIGDGFFGEVFKVTEPNTENVMVMKTMKKASKMKLMCAEIRLMSRLNHPNILKFLGVCIDTAGIHLLTAYMDIGNLEEVVLDAREPLPWSLRMKLAHDISKGMAYLHKIGVIHRDLTSKNILISKETGGYLAVVGDFGLAAKIPSRKTKLKVVGSPYWMAPEVLRDDQYNETVDIFSYGIILCEIIGRVHSNPEELPRTNKYGLDVDKFRELVEGCPAEFLQLAVCCCQLDPEARPCFEVTANFLEFLRQLTIVVGSPTSELTLNNCTENRRMSANIEDWIVDSRKCSAPSFPPCDETCPCEVTNGMTVDTSGTTVVTNGTQEEEEKPADDEKHESIGTPCRRGHPSKRNSFFSVIRYKYFPPSAVTEDLVKNTPSRVAGFFNRVLHVQKKHRFDSRKKRSKTMDADAAERPKLRAYRLFTVSKDKIPSDIQPEPALNAQLNNEESAKDEFGLSGVEPSNRSTVEFIEPLPWCPSKSSNSLVADTQLERSRSNSRASSCDTVEQRPTAVSPVPSDVVDSCSYETDNQFLMSWPQSSFAKAKNISKSTDFNGVHETDMPRCYSASDVRTNNDTMSCKGRTFSARNYSKAAKNKKYWNFLKIFRKPGKEKQNT